MSHRAAFNKCSMSNQPASLHICQHELSRHITQIQDASS